MKVMDRKTRKIMTMNRKNHPHSNTDRLYIPRMEGRQGLLRIKDYKETGKQNLSLNQSQKILLRFLRIREFCHNMKDLYLQLRNRKRKKDTSNRKRTSSLVNL